MNSLKRITVLLLAAALVYAGAAALRPPQARAGINAGVVVNNPTSQPVPITGNVGINGTATVQLAGGSNVEINNLPAVQATRDIDNPARQPFFFRCDLGQQGHGTLPYVEDCINGTGVLIVPDRKRLVIEYVSVDGQFMRGGSAVLVELDYSSDNKVAFILLVPTNVGTPHGGSATAIAGGQTRLYADPGSQLNCIVEGSDNTVFLGGHCIIQGYLVTP